MCRLAFIVSQPRSGSTVLTSILDRKKGIVCMPESSFPQVLGVVTPEERADRRALAALYLGATFPPTPLSLEDAESCMTGNDEEILISLGRSLAGKLGRDPDQVRTVIWKTTRTIGMFQGPAATSGTFIALRRHPHNVFESQSRFAIGIRNRNPLRYAIFAQSYEHALARCPVGRTMNLDYDDLPEALPRVYEFLGIADEGPWESGESSLDLVARTRSWLSQINQEFRNTDPEKRARLDAGMLMRLRISLFIARPLRPLCGVLRSWFDRRSLGHIRQRAADQLIGADRAAPDRTP